MCMLISSVILHIISVVLMTMGFKKVGKYEFSSGDRLFYSGFSLWITSHILIIISVISIALIK